MHTPRTKFKELEFNGKKYRVHKFVPRVGARWGRQLFGDCVLAGVSFKDMKLPQVIALMDRYTRMDDEEDARYWKDTLSHITFQVADGNFYPVLGLNNELADPDLEDSAEIVMMLQAHCFFFSMSPFFSPETLKAVGAATSGFNLGSLFSKETSSENSSGSQSNSNTGDTVSSGTEPTTPTT